MDSLSSSYLLIGHLFQKKAKLCFFFSLFEHIRLIKGSRLLLGLGFDINFTVRFNIDYFGYISGTVHAKFSKGEKNISRLML